jgi:hypothetical protein
VCRCGRRLSFLIRSLRLSAQYTAAPAGGIFICGGSFHCRLIPTEMEERRFGAKPQLNYVAADVGGTKVVKMGMLPR